MGTSLESLQEQLDAHQKLLGEINLRTAFVEKALSVVVHHLGLGDLVRRSGENAPDTSAVDDRSSARRLPNKDVSIRPALPYPLVVQPPPRANPPPPARPHAPFTSATTTPQPPPPPPAAEAVVATAAEPAISARRETPQPGQEAIVAGAGADVGGAANDQHLPLQHQRVFGRPQGMEEDRGGVTQREHPAGPLASPSKSEWSARDDLSAYSAASVMSLPATFRPPPRQPQPQTKPQPHTQGPMVGGTAEAAAAGREGCFGGAAAHLRVGEGRQGGGGAGGGGGWEDAFPEITAGGAMLSQVLAAAGSETLPWTQLLAAAGGYCTPSANSSVADDRHAMEPRPQPSKAVADAPPAPRAAAGDAFKALGSSARVAAELFDTGGVGPAPLPDTTDGLGSSGSGSQSRGGPWPWPGVMETPYRVCGGVVLGAGAMAAVVLMLQCRDDPEARLAVVRTPGCLAVATAMLRDGAPLERRVAAHLLWFVSRSREGARALYDTAEAEPEAATAATTSASSAGGAGTLRPGCDPRDGPIGALVGAMGGVDVHAAKAAALALNNVLMAEGGVEALERCCCCDSTTTSGGAAAADAASGGADADAAGAGAVDADGGNVASIHRGGGGLVGALLDMLSGSDDIGGEAAAACLAAAAERSERMRGQILAGGGVEALSALLLCGDPSTQTSAAGALEQLSLELEGATRLVACGGVRQVVDLLRHGDEDARVRAVGVLRNLADVADCHHAMLRAEVLPELVAVIAAPPPRAPPSRRPAQQRQQQQPFPLSPAARPGSIGPGEEHPGSGNGSGSDSEAGEDEEGSEDGSRGEEAVSEQHQEDEVEEEDEEEEPEVSADREVRQVAVDALVNMATRGGYDVRRTLAADAGGGGGRGGAFDAANAGGGGGGLWALLLVASKTYSWDPATVAWALTGVLALTEDGSLRQELVRQGGVAVLQQVMLGGSPRQRELAAQALANVTTGASDATQEAIAEGGAPIVLCALVRSGNHGARHAACCALQNLARCRACHDLLTAAGAAETLTEAAGDETDAKVAAAAVRALYHLSASISACRQLVTRGSVGALVSAVRRLSLDDMLEGPGFEQETLDAGVEAVWSCGPESAVGSRGAGGYISGVGGGGFGQRGSAAGRGDARPEKTARLLVKVLQRMLLYGDDKGAVRRQVEAALATACIF